MTSLELKKLELRKRLEDRLKEQRENTSTVGGESTVNVKHVKRREKLPKQKQTRSKSAKKMNTVLAKRNLGGNAKFRSWSTISLRSQKSSGKKSGRSLNRVFTRNSPSVSSLTLRDDDSNTGTGVVTAGIANCCKPFENFGDLKKQIPSGVRKKGHPKRKKLSQLLDSFKSEMKEVITATASNLGRLNETSLREIEATTSATTGALSSTRSMGLDIASEGEYINHRPDEDVDSQCTTLRNKNTEKVLSEGTKGTLRKEDQCQASNLRATASIS